jgi:predicted HTH domain antitoxin
MGKLRISIELPEDALTISQLSRRAAGEEMRRLFFLDLVREGRLSHAKAAELLEISLAEFLTFMARHRVSPFVFPEGELRQELGRAK